jgi:hypothetical protein
MAEHGWTVLCEKTLEDSDTKLLTLGDVYDRLIINHSAELPDVEALLEKAHKAGKKGISLPAKIRLVSQWFRSDMGRPEQGLCRILFVDPLGNTVLENEVPLDLLENDGYRITIKADEIRITALGTYYFTVEKGVDDGGVTRWVEQTRLPLNVVAGPKWENVAISPTLHEPPSEPTPAAPRKSSSRRGRARP